jgi:hypothetical protein
MRHDHRVGAASWQRGKPPACRGDQLSAAADVLRCIHIHHIGASFDRTERQQRCGLLRAMVGAGQHLTHRNPQRAESSANYARLGATSFGELAHPAGIGHRPQFGRVLRVGLRPLDQRTHRLT